jgi:hypothetical protein
MGGANNMPTGGGNANGNMGGGKGTNQNTGYNAPTQQMLYAPPTPGSYGNTGQINRPYLPQMVSPQAQSSMPAPVLNNPPNMGNSKGVNTGSFKGTNIPFFAKGGEVNGQ